MRRVAILVGAAIGLGLVCIIILSAGSSLRPTLPEATDIAAGQGALSPEPAAPASAKEPPAAAEGIPGTQQEIAGEEASTGPERVSPRDPLSDLSLALPPQPVPPGEWKPTMLPRPVTDAAGRIEAKGYRIVLAGIEPVDAAEECSFEGASWGCGMGARTAFRAFLRGRSVDCVVPPEPGQEVIVAPCTVGNEDISEWLVENGWARALPDSDYVALGETAVEAGKGMFGKPPPSSAPAPTALDSELPRPPEVDGSILAEPAAEDAAPGAADPLPPRPSGDFPTPPAPPPAPAQ